MAKCLKQFLLFKNSPEPTGQDRGTQADRRRYLECILMFPIEHIVLPGRVKNIFKRLNISYLRDLVKCDTIRILKDKNLGSKSWSRIQSLLSDLDLYLGMKLNDALERNLTEHIRQAKSKTALANELKLEFPDKAKILDEMKFRYVDKGVIDRYLECYRAYNEKGTLALTARKYGVTPERIRQILNEGSKIGLFTYPPEKPYIPKNKLLADYRQRHSLSYLLKTNNITQGYLDELFKEYGISDEDLTNIRLNKHKQDCVDKFNRITKDIGHYPSATDMRKHTGGRSLGNKIVWLWGSLDAFRKEFNIPKLQKSSSENDKKS